MSCTHPVIYTDKDGQYCLVCGARLNAEAVPTVETNENPPEAEKPLEAENTPEADNAPETEIVPEAEKPQETAKKSTKRAAKKDE